MTESNQNLILAIENGEWQGKRFAVPPGRTFVLGRGTDADIAIIVDMRISSVHFEIENRGGSAVLRDLGSRNKTFVNRSVVSTVEVKDGDLIKAGATSFRIEWEPLEKVQPPPPSGQFAKPNSAPIPEVMPVEEKDPFLTFDGDVNVVDIDDPLPGSMAVAGIPEPINPFRDPDKKSETRETSSGSKDTFATESDIDFSQFISDEDELDDDGYEPARRSLEAPPILGGLGRFRDIGFQIDTLYRSPEDYFPRMIELLRLVTDFVVVAHFRKLGQNVPAGLETLSLFSDTSNESPFVPIGVSSDIWIRDCNQNWTRELVRHDGILVAIATDGIERLRRLSDAPLEGFTAQGGIAGWFWPSYLHFMLHRVPRNCIAKWIGDEDIAILYPNMQESVIECISKGTSNQILSELGFS